MANFALREQPINTYNINTYNMNDHFHSLVRFYSLRVTAMETALKAVESERDALLNQLMLLRQE